MLLQRNRLTTTSQQLRITNRSEAAKISLPQSLTKYSIGPDRPEPAQAREVPHFSGPMIPESLFGCHSSESNRSCHSRQEAYREQPNCAPIAPHHPRIIMEFTVSARDELELSINHIMAPHLPPGRMERIGSLVPPDTYRPLDCPSSANRRITAGLYRTRSRGA